MHIFHAVQNAAQTVQKIAKTNAPVILTGVAITGVAATAYFTAVASMKAARALDEDARARVEFAENNPVIDEPRTRMDEFKLVAGFYIPAVVVAGTTIGAIYFANRINSKRLAAMAAAYTISDKAYNEYQDKVKEMFGKNKEQSVQDSVREDQVKNNPVARQTVHVANTGGDHLCYEAYMGHYVMSSMEDLKTLRNEMNDTLLRTDYISLSDWYNQLGIPATSASENLGWRADGGLIELDITTTLSDEGTPCLAFDFRPSPRPGFDNGY